MKIIMHVGIALIISISLMASTVSTAQTDASKAPDAAGDKFEKFLSGCHTQYDEIDGRIDQAGVRDAGYYRIPGFPYLRTDRLMSSYRDALGDLNTLGVWMLQLRENDSIARDIELTNLGMPKYERAALLNDLRVCAVWMSYADLDDVATRQRLMDTAQVPDDYAEGMPKPDDHLTADVQLHHSAIKSLFAHPLNPRQRATLWRPAHEVDAKLLPKGFSGVARDELGRVGLLMNVWPELAAKYAPHLLMENSHANDVLGSPVLGPNGPTIDTTKAIVYYLPNYARIGGRTLVQLVYFVWFPKTGSSSAAPALDGLIWRVTLDEQGQPLLYDTINASGFDPLWFPTHPLKLKNPVGQEMALVPQASTPSLPFTLRLQSGTHVPMRLMAEKKGSDKHDVAAHRYELRPYEDLFTLNVPGGGTQSLFNTEGVIVGTEPADSARYFATGIKHAGALREWGRHPIALDSRVHFDDPFLIDSRFEVPAVEENQHGQASIATP